LEAWASEGRAGRAKASPCPPGEALVDFENFSKKGCFLSFEWEKTNFTTFDPPRKTGIIQQCCPGKNPSDTQAWRNCFLRWR